MFVGRSRTGSFGRRCVKIPESGARSLPLSPSMLAGGSVAAAVTTTPFILMGGVVDCLEERAVRMARVPPREWPRRNRGRCGGFVLVISVRKE